MIPERVLRFEVPSRAVLDRLAAGDLPGGLRGGVPSVDFLREIFFDTAGGDLERRGATVRLCVHRDGARLLTVEVREPGGAAGQVVRRRVEAPVPDEDPEASFAGPSEPARLLRAMVDPERLEAQLELETGRWVREVVPGGAERALRFAADAVTVRHGELAADFQMLEISLPDGGIPDLERVLEPLRAELELRPTLAGTLARARDLLEELELVGLQRSVRHARATAVLAHHEGRVALLRGEDGLRVPTARGWGEEACRQALRAHFGRAQGQIRRLGVSTGVGTRPALEVWLAERISADDEAAEGAREMVWVPFEEALREAGSTALREAATLAALHLAARAGLPLQPDPMWRQRPRSRDDHPFHFRPPVEQASAPRPETGGAKKPSLPPEALLNMELSELAFQERVLALAEDADHPLLERVNFLAILGSNLDEFFMTRVAGFHQQLAGGSGKRTMDGLTAAEQLDAIGVRARQIYARAYGFLWNGIVPELQAQEIRLLRWDDLDDEERSYLLDNYASQLGAALTPLAADPSHPFPHIRNLRPALGVIVRVPETRGEHFAAIELPGDLPRFIPLPGGRRFVPLEEIIAASLTTIYHGLEVVAAHPFRVTRSANFTIDDEISDLLQAVEDKVQKRPLGPVVRLEVEAAMPDDMRDLLLRELQYETRDRVATLRQEDVYPVDRLVDLYGLREIADLPFDEFHYPPLERAKPLEGASEVWPQLRERDVLVHFPYDSFEDSVERLLAEAAEDEQVTSIKVTLYRTDRSSQVVSLLRKARRAGKEVVALVELKASFDEKRNIEWARALESSGIHVVYGPAHLKVHAKVGLIVRREDGQPRRYLYIGTGNLNAATAAGYTDLGLLSTDPVLGDELNDVFNGLTGYSVRTEYDRLLVAPFNMRTRFLEMIDREAEHARAGRGGRLAVKLNGLTDPEIISALYRASEAGVRMDLVVRGLCALRPGVPGLSENIRVISILGRFLEHARIYRFDNAGSPEFYIGSADWRPRNLSRRVEVVTPVSDPTLREHLDEILSSNLSNPDAWELRPDGAYERRAASVAEAEAKA